MTTCLRDYPGYAESADTQDIEPGSPLLWIYKVYTMGLRFITYDPSFKIHGQLKQLVMCYSSDDIASNCLLSSTAM